jgi:hypothetical protein
METKGPDWLLLITNLPGRNQTLRMRVWRALKAAGVGLLRDGVYVLPHSAASQKLFDEQALEIRAGAGIAHVLALGSDSSEQHGTLAALFDRTIEYQALNARLDSCMKDLPKLKELDARRRLAQISRDVAATITIDFFPGPSKPHVKGALQDVEAALSARFSPEEPRAAHRKIPCLNGNDYRGRIWATRKRMWIDRVCSAWLIHRFIDPKAQFVWLKRPKDCPKRAIGFDFDGATFTHVDSKVTFEVLLASFGLEHDSALSRLGALVHFLDVGGIPVPEADGFAAIVSGARSLHLDDDALLKSVTPVIDSLYRSFSSSEQHQSAE